MNTSDVMRKTLELAQSQLNNYKNVPMTDGDLIAELQVIIGKKDEKIVSQQALINAFTKLPDMPDNYTGMEALADHDKEVRRKVLEEASKVVARFKIDWQMCEEELRRMAASQKVEPDKLVNPAGY